MSMILMAIAAAALQPSAAPPAPALEQPWVIASRAWRECLRAAGETEAEDAARRAAASEVRVQAVLGRCAAQQEEVERRMSAEVGATDARRNVLMLRETAAAAFRAALARLAAAGS